jgi:hypothetical protein
MFLHLFFTFMLLLATPTPERLTRASSVEFTPPEPTPIRCRIVDGIRQCRHGENFPEGPVLR